jgi:D-glycero-D-manno-heptose 1,7-bisphosphate phosphatase
MAQNLYLLLDIDGTVIVDKDYLSDYREVELLPGAAEGLLKLRGLGFKFIGISNQSGISRGFLDEEDLRKIHARVAELLDQKGVHLEDIYYCPHHPDDNCSCRKPGTGLAEDAARKHCFNPRDSFVIGDKKSDVLLGHNIGATTFFIKSGKEEADRVQEESNPDYVVEGIFEAARIIEKQIRNRKEQV